jgi:predicted phage terminase large subunit-like protein
LRIGSYAKPNHAPVDNEDFQPHNLHGMNATVLDKATLKAAKRLLKVRHAHDGLIDFTQLTMSHPGDPDDVERSRYDAQYFHRALAAALEAVERGEIQNLIITFPPRHGKSELTSKRFPAWFAGRNPHKSLIFGTYNQDFAEDFGRAVREIVQSDAYAQVFPGMGLKAGSASSARLETLHDGLLVFVGRGGSVTGRGGDGIIIDDPLKNSEEADSPTIRDNLWAWFQNDILTRRMTHDAWVIIIQTRWHEDDLVGRITDPKNPHYDAEEATRWKIINIPAVAEPGDVLGRKEGEALWPSRFNIEFLQRYKRANPRGFSALYQQRPTPLEGDYFKADSIVTYNLQDRPKLTELRVFMASDHAVSLKQENDYTCILIGGVDKNDNLWILDCWWKRAKTDVVVEQLIDFAEKYKPLRWWAESDHITKSIGPFLRKRMAERQIYFSWTPVNAYLDKAKKAQAIQGRMAWKAVLFPQQAHWFHDAKEEMLKFPRAANDDFVDALATFGRGLGLMTAPPKERPTNTGPVPGTWAAIKRSSDFKRRTDKVRMLQANR